MLLGVKLTSCSLSPSSEHFQDLQCLMYSGLLSTLCFCCSYCMGLHSFQISAFVLFVLLINFSLFAIVFFFCPYITNFIFTMVFFTFKAEFYLNYIQNFSSYLADNPVRRLKLHRDVVVLFCEKLTEHTFCGNNGWGFGRFLRRDNARPGTVCLIIPPGRFAPDVGSRTGFRNIKLLII